ncbi:Hypothetical Protein RradSPS_1997 [Rubrobacter radiotolerans]|uniref:Prepilin-type N-terminal cleavage/methylation domain n=1 Tax=Rubrobacter radiotolerans TaxID=42256 RepID=A0A023X5J6_RUBRA|nr:hypothetical protein [Rubrobacter radiotolerans]AHY47280.1 Hypothetical Protein RradSPS_1997 [Rubrobacter radiotolerans]MDX5894685.1 hypothetical protein [Rubrobacter radiotolerans]SMC06535.1 prepilin-type cleavage/methylation-like protein [Rubrobacter radiotolerans DSM 5868]
MRLLAEESGQSLVEVTVAVVILTACILPLAGMFDTALGASGRGGDRDRARLEAHSAVEALRALGYRETALRYAPGRPAVCPDDRPDDRFGCTLETVFVNEDLEPAERDGGRMLVRVRVAWERDGRESGHREVALLAADEP